MNPQPPEPKQILEKRNTSSSQPNTLDNDTASSTTPKTEQPDITQIRQQKLTKFEKNLEYLWSFLDIVGKKLIGDLWETLYLSLQDTIALVLLFQLPGLIGKLTVDNDFSNLESCLEIGWSNVNIYACLIIVASGFTMWILIAGRILGRFLKEFIRF